MIKPAARRFAVIFGLAFTLASAGPLGPTAAGDRGAGPSIRSATEFLSPDLSTEQSDDNLNRGMLWVDRGAALWQEAPSPETKSCAACHGALDRMRGVAPRYPAIDASSGDLLNLEGRVNACRVRHQSASPLPYESEPLLSLTAALQHQSRGMAVEVAVEGAAAAHVATGRKLYDERQGQLNLACRHCHEDNVGRKLRGDTISSGLGTGYPAYRLEWQTLGSLHRRLRACLIGVRARDVAPNSTEHLALELYLAARARGQPIETPALRR